MNVHNIIIHPSYQVGKPKYSSTGEQINKMWYIHIANYYSAIKNNKLLLNVMTWMNLQNKLVERNQIKNTTHYTTPLM